MTETYGQRIDYNSTYRNNNAGHSFEFHYENDFFTKTDYYYSQGITVLYRSPSLSRFFLNKVLYKPAGKQYQYGISGNLFGYTPTSIRNPAIIVGDRPYAANLSFKTSLTVVDSIKNSRISTALSVGVIGPAAFGEEIQTNIHRWLDNRLPMGWRHQIRNDVIMNYQVNLEQLVTRQRWLLVNAVAEGRLGTIDTRIAGGFNLIAGSFSDPYRTTMYPKKIQLFLFLQGKLQVVGYDASLQGGLINRNSPYTISSKDISRIVPQADAGVVVQFKKMILTYSQAYISKEFKTGRYHRWGGVSLSKQF